MPLTIVLDHARYQRCALVHGLAQRLGIAWRFVPAYAPTLHRMERFWPCVKKQCLYSQDYADHHAFQQAIIAGIEQAPDTHQEALASVLTLQVQSCKAVQVIGEEAHVSVFPVARQTQ